VVFPREVGIHDLRRALDPMWLKSRSRIRALLFFVEPISVQRTRRYAFQDLVMIPALRALKGNNSILGMARMDLYLFGKWRPDAEAAASPL
jgi:hypothetical protein